MKRLTTLTGKNLPKLSVAKPGWPERFQPSEDDILAALKFEQRRINQEHADAKTAGSPYDNQLYTPSEDEMERQREIATAFRPLNEVLDFTRVCDQTGLSERPKAKE